MGLPMMTNQSIYSIEQKNNLHHYIQHIQATYGNAKVILFPECIFAISFSDTRKDPNHTFR